MIIGNVKYKKPANCESKKKALRMVYGNAEWFAGAYLVISNGVVRVVGSNIELFDHGEVVELKSADDILVLRTKYRVIILDDKLNTIMNIRIMRDDIERIDCGKVYGYNYVSYGENKHCWGNLVVLDKYKNNILPLGAIWRKKWEEEDGESYLTRWSYGIDRFLKGSKAVNFSQVRFLRIEKNGVANIGRVYGGDLGNIGMWIRQYRIISNVPFCDFEIYTDGREYREVLYKLGSVSLGGKKYIEITGLCAADKNKLLRGEQLEVRASEYAVGLLSESRMEVPMSQKIRRFDNLTANSIQAEIWKDSGIVVLDNEFNVVLGPNVLYHSSSYKYGTPYVKKVDEHVANIHLADIVVGVIVDSKHKKKSLETLAKGNGVLIQVIKPEDFDKKIKVPWISKEIRDQRIDAFNTMRNGIIHWTSSQKALKLSEILE